MPCMDPVYHLPLIFNANHKVLAGAAGRHTGGKWVQKRGTGVQFGNLKYRFFMHHTLCTLYSLIQVGTPTNSSIGWTAVVVLKNNQSPWSLITLGGQKSFVLAQLYFTLHHGVVANQIWTYRYISRCTFLCHFVQQILSEIFFPWKGHIKKITFSCTSYWCFCFFFWWKKELSSSRLLPLLQNFLKIVDFDVLYVINLLVLPKYLVKAESRFK
jgi:hypothetical protein